MEALEEYFGRIIDELPANVGARELERRFGAYARESCFCAEGAFS